MGSNQDGIWFSSMAKTSIKIQNFCFRLKTRNALYWKISIWTGWWIARWPWKVLVIGIIKTFVSPFILRAHDYGTDFKCAWSICRSFYLWCNTAYFFHESEVKILDSQNDHRQWIHIAYKVFEWLYTFYFFLQPLHLAHFAYVARFY